MKHLVFTLLAALVFSGAASAQRLMVGVRGGVNFADCLLYTSDAADE